MTIEASWGRRERRSKSSHADRILAGKQGGEIRKTGKRATEITIPINGDHDGPAVLLSLEGRGEPHFHYRGTIFRRIGT